VATTLLSKIDAPTWDNTAAVAVLFHPEGRLADRLERALVQVSRLVVISNDGQGPQRLAGLDTNRLIYIQSNGNIGLAAALNKGLAYAERKGFIWCLLLDQDTQIDGNLIEELSSIYHLHPEPQKIGVLAPNYRSPGHGRIAYPTNATWQQIETAVTSGSLVSLNASRLVGGMREEFFIEGIDVEFCLRLRAAGLQVIASGMPLMTHGAGTSDERLLFGRTVLVGHHSSWRYFMQFRNLTWTLLRYWRKEPRWTRTTLVSMLKRGCLIFMFEQQKLRKVWAILRGIFAGSARALYADKEPGEMSVLK
jgi:rhamnosyltransferase